MGEIKDFIRLKNFIIKIESIQYIYTHDYFMDSENYYETFETVPRYSIEILLNIKNDKNNKVRIVYEDKEERDKDFEKFNYILPII